MQNLQQLHYIEIGQYGQSEMTRSKKVKTVNLELQNWKGLTAC